MSESSENQVLSPEPVEPVEAAAAGGGDDAAPTEAVQQPAKVMRIGAMIRQLLEEVRRAPLDDEGRARLAEVYSTSIDELSAAVSPDLREELQRLVEPFVNGEGVPTEAELRIAQAQLVGWLEGLFHGIQATLFAQQMEARQQLEELRQRSLPPGAGPDGPGSRPGTYL
jgi:hypothetical protein